MSAPLFYLPKAFLDASPEALGLPDYNEPDEIENGEYEANENVRWLQQEIDNYFDQMEEYL